MLIDLLQLDDSYEDISQEYEAILCEYCQLASQKSLSEEESERLAQILTVADADKRLTFLFNEADHFLAHRLGLLQITDRSRYEQQQAKLRDHLSVEHAESKRQKAVQSKPRIFCSEFLTQRGWEIHYCL